MWQLYVLIRRLLDIVFQVGILRRYSASPFCGTEKVRRQNGGSLLFRLWAGSGGSHTRQNDVCVKGTAGMAEQWCDAATSQNEAGVVKLTTTLTVARLPSATKLRRVPAISFLLVAPCSNHIFTVFLWYSWIKWNNVISEYRLRPTALHFTSNIRRLS